MDVRNGHQYWTYHASGAIKGGPALVGGVLYFGDYAGRAYAVRARDGHQVWAVGTNGAHFGFGSGQFYSTPAVAFGRVYMGNTDGRVYSFGARNGALAWATGTGAYVYASAAVADLPGPRPDRLRRLLRRQPVRLQRPVGRGPLGAPGRRQDLRLGHRGRQGRLLLRPGLQDHDRARRGHRPHGVLVPRRRLHPGDRRLPARSTSTATAPIYQLLPGRKPRGHASRRHGAAAAQRRRKRPPPRAAAGGPRHAAPAPRRRTGRRTAARTARRRTKHGQSAAKSPHAARN